MKKIDVTNPILALGGKPFVGEGGRPQLLRDVLVNVLAQSDPQKKVSAKDKIRQGKLAEKIFENDEVELDAEQVAQLKHLVSDGYPNTILVMRVCEMLDPPVSE